MGSRQQNKKLTVEKLRKEIESRSMCSNTRMPSLAAQFLQNPGPNLQSVAAILLLCSCIYFIASPYTDDSAKHFAYTTIGVMIGVIWPERKQISR